MKWKREKKKYPRSFAKRLTWRIMLRMIIFMGIPIYFLFMIGSFFVEKGASTLLDRILKGEVAQVRRITSDVYVATVNTAPVIEDNLDSPDKMVDYMERMVRVNKRIRSCGISFTENYYPKKGRWFCPYAIRRDSATVETKILGDKDHDYLEEEWFKEALTREEGYWSKLFYDDESGESPLVAYILPIRDSKGRTVAVLGVDLSLEWVSKQLTSDNEVKMETDSTEQWESDQLYYSFMVDSTGLLMIHPNKALMGKETLQSRVSNDSTHVVSHILARKKGINRELTIDGTENYVWYRPVKYTDWTLAIVVRKWWIIGFGYGMGTVLIFFLIIGMLVVLFSGRRTIKKAVRPLNQLAASANEVAKGNFATVIPTLNSRDEIQQLRDSFVQMQQSLTLYVEELKETTAQKSAIENELKIAHDIQMAMLPKTFPPFPERDDIDVYGTLTPAKGVGGDLFDFHIRNEQLFFCIGDVSGKGIPAALVMAVTRSLFRNISSYATRPNDIVYALNNVLCDGNDTNMFVTLFVGVLDLQTHHLFYCNAGHNAPLLVGNGVSELSCDCNVPVGIISDFRFSLQETDIAQDTTIFLFTDGLNEAENAVHAQFGDERIQSLAASQLERHEHQPLNLIFEMDAAVRRFVDGAEQSDDLTMLAVQVKN